MVGAAIAQALALKETVSDIALIDIAQELVWGQAMDISHGTVGAAGVRVRVGDYSEIRENDIVIITCGLAQKPGQTRMELLAVNAGIIRDVVDKVMKQGRPVYMIMVANPVDVLTQVALESSGLPRERVFGTGTSLDTARLGLMLAEKLDVSQRDVQAFVFGEHGDSSFPALSAATVSGMPLQEFPGYSGLNPEKIAQSIHETAYKIIEAKKSTYFGIAGVTVPIVEALLRDSGRIMPLSSLAKGEYGLNDVTLSLPCTVNSKGAHIIEGYPLSKEEQGQLRVSAGIIKAALHEIGQK